MTSLRFSFLFLTLLIFGACKNIDQVLVGEIQNRNAEFESLKGEYNAYFDAVAAFSERVHQSNDAVKADSGYVQVLNMIETFTGKGNNRLNEIASAQGELTQLLADYSSGVKKTDDVRKDYQRIGTYLKDLRENLDYLNGLMAKSQQQLDTLQAATASQVPVTVKAKK